MRAARSPVRTLWARIWRARTPPSRFAYDQVVRGRTWACADLGAFPRPLPRLAGLEGVVLMEDRHPEFFLSFDGYRPSAPTRLNRHGPRRAWATQQDLKELVAGLRAQGIRVAVGFWNYGSWWPLRQIRWLRTHPELRRMGGSSYLYPFVRLTREAMPYAAYIARQYERLTAAFEFGGLMLGDGLCGFGTIRDPNRYRDQAHTVPLWADLYRTIAASVHRSHGVLLAYDHMGDSAEEAREYGADYRALAEAGLDILVFQSYPHAWGDYWLAAHRSRFDLASSARNLAAVKTLLSGTGTRVFYTLELSDSVEGWVAAPEGPARQAAALDPIADGRFLVWANDVFAATGGRFKPSTEAKSGRDPMTTGLHPRDD